MRARASQTDISGDVVKPTKETTGKNSKTGKHKRRRWGLKPEPLDFLDFSSCFSGRRQRRQWALAAAGGPHFAPFEAVSPSTSSAPGGGSQVHEVSI